MESLILESRLDEQAEPENRTLGRAALSGIYPNLLHRYHQWKINKGYSKWAGSLAERSAGQFTVAPKEKRRLYQSAETHYFPSAITSSGGPQRNEQEYTNNLYWLSGEAAARFADGSFFKAVDRLSQSELIAMLPEASQDQNIALITPHPSLNSPFLEELAVAYASGDSSVARRMSIMLSPTLGWLEVPVGHDPKSSNRQSGTVNAIDISSRLFNVWPVLPDNAKKYGLEKYMAAQNQPVTRAMIDHLRHDKGNIVALNPSGSLDLVNQQHPGIEMQRVKDTRARFIAKYFDGAFFVMSWANPQTGEFDLRFSKDLTPLQEAADVHQIMEDMAQPYYELVNGTGRPGGIPIWYGDRKIAQ